MQHLTIDQARTMHSGELGRIGDDPVAVEQLALRSSAAERVRGLMAAAGLVFSGTGGWHILPCVDPEGRVGWVDSTEGKAYLTDEVMPEAERVAVTVPDQDAGAVAGGNGASSAVAGSRNVEMPDGWVQLVIDVRGGKGEPADTSPARLVAYGMQTCYEGRRGAPVDTWVDRFELVDAEIVAEIREMAGTWVDGLIAQLAERAGVDDVARHFGPRDDAQLPWPLWSDLSNRSAECVVVSALYRSGEEWADGEPIARVCDAADNHCVLNGDRRGRLADLLSTLVSRRAKPILDAAPGIAPDESRSLPDFVHRRTWVPVLRAIAEDELREANKEADALGRQMVDVLYRGGAIVTRSGRGMGVACTSPREKPVARPCTYQGQEAMEVPFGADVPEEFDVCAVLGVNYEIRIRSTAE